MNCHGHSPSNQINTDHKNCKGGGEGRGRGWGKEEEQPDNLSKTWQLKSAQLEAIFCRISTTDRECNKTKTNHRETFHLFDDIYYV